MPFPLFDAILLCNVLLLEYRKQMPPHEFTSFEFAVLSISVFSFECSMQMPPHEFEFAMLFVSMLLLEYPK